MNRRTAILALVGGVLTLATFLFFHFFEWEREEQTLPPRGAAAFNPLHALGNALRAQGHEVRPRATLELDAMALAPGDALLLATDVRVFGQEQAEALGEWVEGGGRLVFALPDADADRLPPLLTKLGLFGLVEGSGCLDWRADGAIEAARLCARSGLSGAAARGADWAWADDDGVVRMAAGRHGDGAWLLLPEFDFLARRALENPSHARLAEALLLPLLGDGRVHVVYAVDLPPLYVLLAEHGWPIWAPLLLALLAWLWRRSQRLGPLLPLAAPDRRALLEHLRAAGEFALRRRRGGALYAALRRRFEARLQRDAPALAALSGEEQVQALAAAWRLDPALVRSALQPADLARPEAFAASIRSLSQLQAPP